MKTLTLNELIERLSELKTEGHGKAEVLMAVAGACTNLAFAEMQDEGYIFLMDSDRS